MRFRVLPLIVAVAAAICGCAKVKQFDATAQSTGGVFAFGTKSVDKLLRVSVTYSPNPVTLGRSGQMDVTVAIVNITKQQQTFGTQTEQPINVVVREVETGRVLSQVTQGASEDPKLTSPLLNPGERFNFQRRLSTKEMRAGRTYQIEAFVVGYDDKLRGQVQFVPQ